jgi:hypothetical protein
VQADVPPEGPALLAVDADGDGQLEVCWAGGDSASADSAALFAVRANGQGLFDPATYAFATLDARPLQPLAAISGSAVPRARFVVTTRMTGPDLSSPGGRVWLLDHTGNPLPGWPVTLPAAATTPPVVYRTSIYVGAADGHVYALDTLGTVVWTSSAALSGAIGGRLAVWTYDPTRVMVAVAAGSVAGEVAVFDDQLTMMSGWPRNLVAGGFVPDFLWLSFDGGGRPAGAAPVCGAAGTPTLIVHHANRLWAFCPSGELLPGWGHELPDTLLPGLAAGDVDHDGYLEVITQGRRGGVAFFNQSGAPSPGWPLPTTREAIPAGAPALAADVDGDGAPEIVSFDGSGRLNAIRPDKSQPDGWPLALGAGAAGSALVADLDQDGRLDVVAPDRPLTRDLQYDINGRFSTLYAYSLPSPPGDGFAMPWPMVGHDPGRSSALPLASTPLAAAPAGGPYVPGSLKVYPNPARRKPVAFAFRLTEPARVDVDILDTSGHKVAGFGVDGLATDNVAVWEPGQAPAGLYLARVHIRGASGSHSEIVQVGVLR